jgi:hypothetical protein
MSCAGDGSSTSVDAFVGFNGAYFVFEFVGLPDSDPELWELINPASYADHRPDFVTRFIVGANDSTQPPRHVAMVEAFSTDRRRLGYDSGVVRVEAEHGYSFEPGPWEQTLQVILSVVARS